MSKIEPQSKRELNIQGSEGLEKASTFDVKATSESCLQETQEIGPHVFQNGPKIDPRKPKIMSKFDFNLISKHFEPTKTVRDGCLKQ